MSNALILQQPQANIDSIVSFIRETFTRAHKTDAVIAVSGGIDSALSLTLLTKALSPEHIHPMLLPHGEQNMDDAREICTFNAIPTKNVLTVDIQPIVDSIVHTLGITEPMRKGNIMARSRMIAVYDLAKEKDALVCGTENKSEHYLGYFTRFGDAASDVEPISTLYKTQVRQLAQFLKLPVNIIEKNPSAGLWENQTDEQELGFTYEDADKVLFDLMESNIPEEKVAPTGVAKTTVTAILNRVHSQRFKLEVPYTL